MQARILNTLWYDQTLPKPIGPIPPNWAPRCGYLLSAVQVHRKQQWDPHLLRFTLPIVHKIMMAIVYEWCHLEQCIYITPDTNT